MKQRKTRKDKGRKRLLRNISIGATSAGILGTVGLLIYQDKKKYPFGKPKQGVRKLTSRDNKTANKYTTVDINSSDNTRKAKLFLASSGTQTADFGRGRDRKKRNRRSKRSMSLGKALAIGIGTTVPITLASKYLFGGISGKRFEGLGKNFVDKYSPNTPFPTKTTHQYGMDSVREELRKPGKLISGGILAGGAIYAASRRKRKSNFNTELHNVIEFARGRGRDKRKRRRRKSSGLLNIGKFLPHPNYVAAGSLIAAGAVGGGLIGVSGKYALNARKLGAKRLQKLPNRSLPNPNPLDEIILGHSVFKDKYSRNQKWGRILAKGDDKVLRRGMLAGGAAGALAGTVVLGTSKLQERKEDKETKKKVNSIFYPHRKFNHSSTSDVSEFKRGRGRDKRKRQRRRGKSLSYNQAAKRTEKLANSALAFDRDILMPATVTASAVGAGLLGYRYLKGARQAAKTHKVPMGFAVGEVLNNRLTKPNSVMTIRAQEQEANSKILGRVAGLGAASLGANYVYQRYWSKNNVNEAKKRKRQNKAKK